MENTTIPQASYTLLLQNSLFIIGNMIEKVRLEASTNSDLFLSYFKLRNAPLSHKNEVKHLWLRTKIKLYVFMETYQ
jgi:hypothetical protein